VEDVLGDATFFLRLAWFAFALGMSAGLVRPRSNFLLAERDPMLAGARLLALGHGSGLLLLDFSAPWLRVLRGLREEQGCDERDGHRSGSCPPRSARRAPHVRDLHGLGRDVQAEEPRSIGERRTGARARENQPRGNGDHA